MWFALAAPFLFLLTSPSATAAATYQGSGPPGVMEEEGSDDVEGEGGTTTLPELNDDELNQALLDEAAAFGPLESRYINALGGYQFEVRELRDAGMKPSEYPPRPVFEYYPVFAALAESGNGPAAFWLIQNAKQIVQDNAERGEFYRGYFTQLATKNASGQYVKGAIEQLLSLKRMVGEDFAIEFLQTVQTNSRRRGTVAEAIYGEAQMLVAGERGLDPERQARAADLYLILVDGYAGTDAAKMAGTPLLKAILEDMRGAQKRWLATARTKIAAGNDQEADWGPFPFEDYTPQILAVAGAGQPIAQAWANRIFPALRQAARESTGSVIEVEAGWLARKFGSSNVAWMDHKYDLLDFLYTMYPDAEFTFHSVQEVQKRIHLTKPELNAPVLETLLANTTDDRIRAEAQFALAQTLTRSDSHVGLERAQELFELAATTAPIERQRKEAADMGLQFSWSMPGAVHPALNLVDSDQLPVATANYRGKVLVIYFWTLDVPGSAEDLDFAREMQSRYADEAFGLLGLNCEMMDLAGFAKVSRKHDITWRNALLQKRGNYVAQSYWVSRFPHHFVIDAKGVIRGRGLSHEETFSLVDELLAEMKLVESAPEKAAAGLGSVRGLVRFGGSKLPLPDLNIPDDKRKACTSRNGQMDMTDRSRLVSEGGGLANVVISVHVPDAMASGVGERRLVRQINCRYEPHILIVPQGARLEVVNDDTVLHGATARSLVNTSFNVVLPPGQTYSTDLNGADRFELTSDTHPWMSSWVIVTDTPHMVLSDARGEFALPDLPAGKYVAEWWHESLGKGLTAEFEIKPGGTALIELVLEGE